MREQPHVSNLYGGIDLGTWSRDECFALYTKIVAGEISPAEHDRFTRLLMHVVSQSIAKISWRRTLARAKIDPEEAAAEVLSRLVPKVARFRLAKPCALTLIASLNTAIARLLITLVRSSDRISIVRAGQLKTDCQYRDRRTQSPSLRGVIEAMHEAETSICGDDEMMLAAWRFMCDALLTKGKTIHYDKLPDEIKISDGDHARLAFRLNKLVERAAANVPGVDA